MTHDRAGAKTFRSTQVFLAQMFGVRRSGVTVAAGLLLDRKFIHYRHDVMQILDRRGLEAMACPCYRIFNGVCANHLGPTN